jgi:hypothetical protein
MWNKKESDHSSVVSISEEAIGMKESLSDTMQKHEYLRCSVMTPTGCLIRCQCGNVFSPSDLPEEETCPECGRAYHPGFIYDIEVVSKRSGMSLGVLHAESVGEDLNQLSEYTVQARYGVDCHEFCSWQITNRSVAYFGADREES